MKISDLLQQNTLSVSFEVFPPKTESGFDSVRTATEEIARLHPAYMSVTYGAGGGTSRYTLDIAACAVGYTHKGGAQLCDLFGSGFDRVEAGFCFGREYLERQRECFLIENIDDLHSTIPP